MAYSIVLKKSVEKDIRKLPKNVIPRIVSRIEALASDPYPKNSVKIEGAERTYRLRVGDYRIIYQVDKERREILILHVRHRRDAYRML